MIILGIFKTRRILKWDYVEFGQFFNLQHRLFLKIKKLATNGKIIPIIGLKIIILQKKPLLLLWFIKIWGFKNNWSKTVKSVSPLLPQIRLLLPQFYHFLSTLNIFCFFLILTFKIRVWEYPRNDLYNNLR